MFARKISVALCAGALVLAVSACASDEETSEAEVTALGGPAAHLATYSDEENMDSALLAGVLVEHEGCVAVRDGDGKITQVLVHSTALEKSDETAQPAKFTIRGEEFELGDEVEIGGSATEWDDDRQADTGEQCTLSGEVWLANEVSHAGN